MIDAADPALYQRPKSFQRVNVHVALNINFRRVMDALVLKTQPLERIVNSGLIGIDSRTRQYPLDDVWQYRSLGSIGDDTGNYPSATFHRAPYWLLPYRSTTGTKPLIGVLVLFLSAHESFIGFDSSNQIADIFLEHRAYLLNIRHAVL